MYITLSNLQCGKPVSLPHGLSNEVGTLEIALCEITYYPRWFNISIALANNKMIVGKDLVTIPDGYYNVCELDAEVFQPLGATLKLHSPTGRLQIFYPGLMDTLGYTHAKLAPRETHMAGKMARLAVHRELFVHLHELSTSQNVQNSAPSTLLRAVSVENEKCGSGRSVAFPALQYKRLAAGFISHMTVMVLDGKGRPLDTDYVSVVLSVRDG